ncbi:MAG: ribosome biogenesis GTPase Der [Candidatus Melainabacteria bacterium RIFOXYA12_FULL_32_12]|nr:MAG: ribosome biogenesis GTPase Der [Candidatus Melainabacteria bacterium RIFOXYA2_FULL_32_9]OGI29009.1 MAG: ribosome biogenesis GTPase Der [Candidatus Melainabacteria bacterium RIFOXYA12_FULL_32_12]
MKRKPIVAIVGRPNVGKSTFVNRLLGSRESIVDDMPGVTRDRLYFNVEWAGHNFTVIDTGGIVPGMEDEIMMSIYTQVEIATAEADVIIFMVDGKEGLNPVDIDVANLLRKSEKPIFLTVNKIDIPEKTALVADFYSLGIGEPYPVSSMHGTGGIGDLLDDLIKALPEFVSDEEVKPIHIAIVGRPNAGKSSLVNSLLGEERVIVSEIAGTTRDAINTNLCVDGNCYTLVDTAGIRRKARVEYGIEKFSVARSIKAIKNSDVTLLLIDATEGITDQDKKIGEISNDAGRAIVIAVNKWDLIEDKHSTSTNEFTKLIRKEAPHLSFAPILFISAVTKQRINKIFAAVLESYEYSHKKISTSLLNKVILEAFALNPPTSKKGKRLKAYYSTQIGVEPPTFVIFVNSAKLISDSYKRYLENKLREAFGFFGTPIKILIRERSEKGK